MKSFHSSPLPAAARATADNLSNLAMRVPVPTNWFNIVPFIEKTLGLSIPPLLHPKSGAIMTPTELSRILPQELAEQELSSTGQYRTDTLVPIPEKVISLYRSFRPTPLVRCSRLEKALGVSGEEDPSDRGGVRIFCKREDVNVIGSYKLNSSYVQAFYAQARGCKEMIGDTGPGNWGMGMALACKEFGVPSTIYMEKSNYLKKIDKVRVMEKFGANVIPVSTDTGTIAASLSLAIEHVMRHESNRLSLGCLTAYSALHNTVIGLELRDQLKAIGIEAPDAVLSVVGGGSSFSGLIFPLIGDAEMRSRGTKFIAVESASVPSFSQGTYRYENPDLLGLMPRAKMYTLGNTFVPTEQLGASGLNYHGKNHLLSLLVHEGHVQAVAYRHEDVDPLQTYFEEVEGILPASESCYAVKGAIECAKALARTRKSGEVKNVVFCLTGNANSLEF